MGICHGEEAELWGNQWKMRVIMKDKAFYNGRINNYKHTLEYVIWRAGLLVGGLAVMGIALVHVVPIRISDLGMDCWIHRTAGIYCPGCGMTRAVFAMAHGRIFLSAWYHPAVLYGAIVYGIFMLGGLAAVCSGGRLPFMRWRIGYVYGGIVVIIAQFLAKNIMLIGFHLQWMP